MCAPFLSNCNVSILSMYKYKYIFNASIVFEWLFVWSAVYIGLRAHRNVCTVSILFHCIYSMYMHFFLSILFEWLPFVCRAMCIYIHAMYLSYFNGPTQYLYTQLYLQWIYCICVTPVCMMWLCIYMRVQCIHRITMYLFNVSTYRYLYIFHVSVVFERLPFVWWGTVVVVFVVSK